MHRIIGALFALCLTVVGVTATQATELKRLTLRQDVLGWEAVGRVDLGRSNYCTGVLIATDLVLTAAHCVVKPERQEIVPVDTITFRAGLRDDVAIAESGVSQLVVSPAYLSGLRNTAERVRQDVALLKLSNPISAATASPFRVTSLSADTSRISVVSFARGRDAALSRENRCNVTGRGNGLMQFDCDLYYGSSGAPVFDLSSGRPRIVSIISMGNRENDKATSYGMELPRRVAELKNAFRTGVGVWPPAEAFEARRLTTSSDRSAGGARFVKP